MNLFKSKTVKIQGRANPNESIADHQHLDTDLKNAVFISEVDLNGDGQIDYDEFK